MGTLRAKAEQSNLFIFKEVFFFFFLMWTIFKVT